MLEGPLVKMSLPGGVQNDTPNSTEELSNSVVQDKQNQATPKACVLAFRNLKPNHTHTSQACKPPKPMHVSSQREETNLQRMLFTVGFCTHLEPRGGKPNRWAPITCLQECAN